MVYVIHIDAKSWNVGSLAKEANEIHLNKNTFNKPGDYIELGLVIYNQNINERNKYDEAERLLDSAHQPSFLTTSHVKVSDMYNKTPTDFGSSQFPVEEDRGGRRNGSLHAIKIPDKSDRPRIL